MPSGLCFSLNRAPVAAYVTKNRANGGRFSLAWGIWGTGILTKTKGVVDNNLRLLYNPKRTAYVPRK